MKETIKKNLPLIYLSKATLTLTAVLLAALFLSSPALAEKALTLTTIDHASVCMVNDEVFDREMIPVEYEGKTYYGCCKMCAGKINNDRSVRYGVDPVSGHEVDKAKAVILEGPEKAALYFESEETAREYLAKTKK